MIEIGHDLTDAEIVELGKRWIDPATARAAGLKHLNHVEGKELIAGRGSFDYSGIGIWYFLPGRPNDPVAARLRRENPEIDARTGKPSRKYLSAPGDRNRLYFPRHLDPKLVQDINVPVIVTEGELKTLALWRLANWRTGVPEFIPVGVSGVNNFMGIIGTTTNEYGARVAVRGQIPDMDLLYYRARKFIIAFDSDAVLKDAVKKARWALSIILRERGAEVGNLEWDMDFGKGVDDWLAGSGPEVVLEAIRQIQFNSATGWKARLYTTDTGKPKALGVNAQVAVANAPEFAGLMRDEFADKVLKPSTLPWWERTKHTTEWIELDTLELTYWLQSHHIEVGKDSAYDAVQAVASRHTFHPVRDYLNSLHWDSEPRVDQWLTRYAGVKLDPYTSTAGRCWLISAVARIFQPGCKADAALMFIGAEGLMKSSLCRLLGEPWFSDDLPDLSEKDAKLHLVGRWIVELQELAALNKAALTSVKAYMSRSVDIYRPMYGRQNVEHPRQTVFLATTNEYEPLKDTTGNRRFWPVEVGKIELDALHEDRDQLWAEAVELYRQKAVWWLQQDSVIEAAKREQAKRVDVHVWLDRIKRWVINRESVTLPEVLDQCINKPVSSQTQADKVGVVRCLQQLGWRQARRRVQGVITRVYLNPDFLETGFEDVE